MLLLTLGLIVPSLGSMANSTVHLKPWRLARIFASCGSASSERYSSSPLTRTTCLPLPGPSPPAKVSHGSAAAARPTRATAVNTAAPTAMRNVFTSRSFLLLKDDPRRGYGVRRSGGNRPRALGWIVRAAERSARGEQVGVVRC